MATYNVALFTNLVMAIQNGAEWGFESSGYFFFTILLCKYIILLKCFFF
jgi:hypothetical protein